MYYDEFRKDKNLNRDFYILHSTGNEKELNDKVKKLKHYIIKKTVENNYNLFLKNLSYPLLTSTTIHDDKYEKYEDCTVSCDFNSCIYFCSILIKKYSIIKSRTIFKGITATIDDFSIFNKLSEGCIFKDLISGFYESDEREYCSDLGFKTFTTILVDDSVKKEVLLYNSKHEIIDTIIIILKSN